MIKGDSRTTARAIPRQAGIIEGGTMTRDALSALSDAERAEQVSGVSICARIMPEQKPRIVNAFEASGEIVAMTGDRVNDAPSLKAAHIGIAVGGRGTDVAREAAAIVLLLDDFSSIVKAIRLGRRIYDNLRKAMAFIFAVHVPIAGLACCPCSRDYRFCQGPSIQPSSKGSLIRYAPWFSRRGGRKRHHAPGAAFAQAAAHFPGPCRLRAAAGHRRPGACF